MSNNVRILLSYIMAIGYLGLVIAVFAVIANFLQRSNRPRQFVEPRAKLDRKERAIYQQLRYVGSKLRQRYGTKRAYTTAQVKATLSEGGYSGDYDCYALAIYCDAPDFNEYHRSIGETCNYNLMRSEVVHSFESIFHDNTNFDANDAIDYSSQLDSAPEVTDTSARSSAWFDLFTSSDSHSGGHYGDSGSHSHSDFGDFGGGDFGGGD